MMKMVSPYKKPHILVSAGIWLLLGFLVLLFQPLTWGFRLPAVFLIRQAVHFVVAVCLYYLTTRLVVPRTLFRNKIWPFIVWVILATAFATGLAELLHNKLHIFEEMMKATGEKNMKRHTGVDIFTMITTLLVIGVGTSVAAFSRWQKDALLREELEREKIQSELSFLKAQINPHFFFNTLNNIYSLSFIDVPPAQDALHKLSRMMRYLLYETQNNSTTLRKELSFLKDYIALMKLRMRDSGQVSYLEPEVGEEVALAPMLLLPYVENAFKHGISAAGNDRIDIRIDYSDHVLTMYVENSLHNAGAQTHFEEHSGIGLQNTLRRLHLLYAGRFTLEAGPDLGASIYRTYLKLELL